MKSTKNIMPNFQCFARII